MNRWNILKGIFNKKFVKQNQWKLLKALLDNIYN
jgi:hypothetical protein